MSRLTYTHEHHQFRELVRDFVRQTVAPNHESWERDGQWDRSLFIEAGKLGLLGFSVPEHLGGPGVDDFRYNAIVIDELQRAGAAAEAIAFTLQNDVVLPYLTDLTTPEQQQRWLPGVVTGETVLGIGMTEPGTGSDLAGIRTTAVRDGDDYVVNGAKTFISNGQVGDLFVIAVRTSPDRHQGLSLLVVDADTPGFSRGRNLEKIGLHAQDTSELTFTDMRVPKDNLLESEGRGFYQLMKNLPQERLALGVGAVAAAETILAATLDYVRDRTAFGSPIASFQHSQFVLAELATEIDVARTYLDDCLAEHLEGELTAARAARLKWWTTDLQVRTADRCLQLHGGYGYMREYSVARAFVDARIQTIYGGTNEIMKTIIAKDLGL
ncbi:MULTISPECIES: acyl-CoA dehydrogenase family protein [Mycobacterium]|uniref:Acyl-[acyl-carrier-protein] dehydrogenase MbtN n=1 Tax=Mycobacterium intracellulare (strain ATCC 13950 / DSM 43223 / JCM 6384 / NCTC 13025 / 3600) TaxID=487521 RepID=H8IV93_MYCIA|nr:MULTISPECIES: acyl-CoA dehydrogenase family protein [Mycobacterium]AFC45870.1 long-chain specific acyl-CoA dehydrogenase [Mycobacterium intracellulare ATCC 13950]AFC51041.1 long-chain specific acyl-CoA dehydrogenase [Mycobacterium intracellulare MOTT-02]ASW97565.1 acyl-CoA dehydrogenase [Mycobacterium intracellulare]MCA2234362.1 acyl-CoA dehydrogenase family protein [Mycobacterium intracellulare]MCA2276548.1 acyl-CoA dehydrogenase family protein [Mycobacterium intracellulare]